MCICVYVCIHMRRVGILCERWAGRGGQAGVGRQGGVGREGWAGRGGGGQGGVGREAGNIRTYCCTVLGILIMKTYNYYSGMFGMCQLIPEIHRTTERNTRLMCKYLPALEGVR